MAIQIDYKLPGAMIRRLMRKHRVTIRSLAQKYDITMVRVREVRMKGVRGFYANEYHFMITGVWLDNLPSDGKAVRTPTGIVILPPDALPAGGQ